MSASHKREQSERKVSWTGEIASVQPRIRLTRSFDQRDHEYLGFILQLDGEIDGAALAFSVAVSERDHAKHQFCVRQEVRGEGWTVPDLRVDIAQIHRTSRIEVLSPGTPMEFGPPPWFGVAPDLSVYRERGHRRLSAVTYSGACSRCIWGCKMSVALIVDHWKPTVRRFRMETFCYGPLSCRVYMPGPTRKVPGRKGMSYEEEDWVDKEAVSHRRPDE